MTSKIKNSIYRGRQKQSPGGETMTKPKAKAEPPALPVIKEEPIQLPVEKPHLVITETVATDFMKEINGAALPEPLPPKQNAFIDKLVKAVKPKAERALEKKDDPAQATQKAALIAKISLNVNSFEPLLRDFIQPDKTRYLDALPKRSLAELEIAFKTLEHARIVGNATNQLKHIVFIGASAVEVFTQRMGLRSEGYAQALRAQETELKMILHEIAMERAETLEKYQRPEIRLALLLSTTLLSLDTANRSKELEEATAKEKISAQVEEQYRDL